MEDNIANCLHKTQLNLESLNMGSLRLAWALLALLSLQSSRLFSEAAVIEEDVKTALMDACKTDFEKLNQIGRLDEESETVEECKELMSNIVSSINGEADYDNDLIYGDDRDIDSPIGMLGQTALMMAVIKGYEDASKVLISAGANVNKINTDWGVKETALMYAAQFGWPDICEILLSKGADINQKNHVGYGKTALDIAKENHHSEVVTILERYGATVSEVGLEQILEFHGTSLADIDKKDEQGYTPLIYAAILGNNEACRLLIEAGADVNEVNKDNYEETALMKAADNGFKEICQKLIEAGANLEMQDINGKTALMKVGYGYGGGHADIAKMLISAGADVNKLDVSGETALYLASSEGSTEIVKMLIKEGADLDVAETGTRNGFTPLIKAAKEGYTEVCRLLIEAGTSVDKELHGGGTVGQTALLWAALDRHTETSTLLIKAGASIQKVTNLEMDYDWEKDAQQWLAKLGEELGQE